MQVPIEPATFVCVPRSRRDFLIFGLADSVTSISIHM